MVLDNFFLTFLQISRIFINTNAMHQSGANAAEIAQKLRGCLASEPLVPKNRVWVSVYKGLSDICPEFLRKKSLAQFAFGFGVYGATARLGAK